MTGTSVFCNAFQLNTNQRLIYRFEMLYAKAHNMDDIVLSSVDDSVYGKSLH